MSVINVNQDYKWMTLRGKTQIVQDVERARRVNTKTFQLEKRYGSTIRR